MDMILSTYREYIVCPCRGMCADMLGSVCRYAKLCTCLDLESQSLSIYIEYIVARAGVFVQIC